MIVNLAVVDDHIAAARRVHRLVPAGREVDDRQPVMREGDAVLGVEPDVRMIGAAVDQDPIYPAKRRADIGAIRPVTAEDSGYTAHQASPLPPITGKDSPPRLVHRVTACNGRGNLPGTP